MVFAKQAVLLIHQLIFHKTPINAWIKEATTALCFVKFTELLHILNFEHMIANCSVVETDRDSKRLLHDYFANRKKAL